MTLDNSTSTTETAGSSSEGPAVRLCSKCKTNPRQARGSWCTECRREAQRAYNTRTRPRPQEKSANCAVCGATMTWISGQGPDRVYCSVPCKRQADTAVQTERRRERVDPTLAAARSERHALREQGLRRCNTCVAVRPLEDFHRRGAGHQHRCIACTAEWGRDNIATAKLRSWRSHLKKRFNLTPEAWDALLISQAGRCWLCGDPMREPHVDHDHECCAGRSTCGGCIRGLACSVCNVSIGQYGEDADRMRRAAETLAQAQLRRSLAP